MGSRMFPSTRISTILMHQQTCQLSLIQSETQAIKSSLRVRKSEKIAPILTSLIHAIIEQNFEKRCTIILKSHSIAPSEVGRSVHEALVYSLLAQDKLFWLCLTYGLPAIKYFIAPRASKHNLVSHQTEIKKSFV